MKLAAGWFRDRRGFALGVLIGALTLGKAFPHLLTALYGQRMASADAAGVCPGGGGRRARRARGARRPVRRRQRRAFDPRAIWKIVGTRGARLATFGYLGHMWELYAMWTWIGVLATASFAAAGDADSAAAGSLAAFVAIASGTAGCVLAGWLADRLGRARVAIWAMWTSAACAALTAVVFGRPPVWFFVLAAIWGFAVVADSAQFSALVSEHSPPDHIGTALTLQTCAGLSVDDGDDRSDAAARGQRRLAVGLTAAGPDRCGIVAMRRLERQTRTEPGTGTRTELLARRATRTRNLWYTAPLLT